jgi:hypothetical protein
MNGENEASPNEGAQPAVEPSESAPAVPAPVPGGTEYFEKGAEPSSEKRDR